MIPSRPKLDVLGNVKPWRKIHTPTDTTALRCKLVNIFEQGNAKGDESEWNEIMKSFQSLIRLLNTLGVTHYNSWGIKRSNLEFDWKSDE